MSINLKIYVTVTCFYLSAYTKYKCMSVKYEASTIKHLAGEAGVGKKEKWLPFKKLSHVDLISHVHIPGAYVMKPRAKRSIILIKEKW